MLTGKLAVDAEKQARAQVRALGEMLTAIADGRTGAYALGKALLKTLEETPGSTT